ncbi:HAD family phosphatase [Peribacillus saganii]|uniref:HAD family phosphatase n=1 Tax=Peribacillus saganii TaxID=2303992 RepID=A0A372LDV5_9BACI|nr:Cof-type HAD-IIB family hydrolase [Peribacillus saganii]RFU64440.1 HAD family phosphatase [Peribacillus saganii]
MVFRLLAVNIDGTLLQSNGRLNKSTKEAMEFVHQKGVHIALVTSRNFLSAKKVAKALKINPMIVAHQGAYVGSPAKKPLFIKRISEEHTLEIVQFLEKANCQIKVIHEKFMVGNRVNLPENILGKAVMYMNEGSFYSNQYVNTVSEALEDNPVSPPKIDAVFETEKEKREVCQLLTELYPEVTTIQLPNRKLTIVPRGVSKWSGVLYLAEHLGVKKEEIVAIGDGPDDIEMIENSGVGVAMSNSEPDVKRAAKWITRTNDEQGVAYMLKEFFRKQHPIEFLEKLNMLK